MGRLLLKDVFAALDERLTHVETLTDARFAQTETAITKIEDKLRQRIDALDGRMDEFFKKVKDRHAANHSSDDPS